jgi:hypothetical protein
MRITKKLRLSTHLFYFALQTIFVLHNYLHERKTESQREFKNGCEPSYNSVRNIQQIVCHL